MRIAQTGSTTAAVVPATSASATRMKMTRTALHALRLSD
jgi:hypothetical protein